MVYFARNIRFNNYTIITAVSSLYEMKKSTTWCRTFIYFVYLFRNLAIVRSVVMLSQYVSLKFLKIFKCMLSLVFTFFAALEIIFLLYSATLSSMTLHCYIPEKRVLSFLCSNGL